MEETTINNILDLFALGMATDKIALYLTLPICEVVKTIERIGFDGR